MNGSQHGFQTNQGVQMIVQRAYIILSMQSMSTLVEINRCKYTNIQLFMADLQLGSWRYVMTFGWTVQR